MNALARWNPVTRWNPARELEELQSKLSNILDFPTLRKNGEKEALAIAEWAPAVDITEDDKEYVVKAELPEVKKEEVKVTVENGILSISGERKFEKEEKGKKYHRIERSYGSFVRSFSLPDDADSDKVEAKFSEGILTVHVSKSEAARPKEIEVKVS
jgi:HSP20 family protein